jgi:hypothetical protein
MQTLEREIIAKFQQLQPDARVRVLEMLLAHAHPEFNYDAWWGEVERLQSDIRARIGETETIDALGLLDELREEAS